MSQNVRTLLHVFSTFNIGGPQIRFVQLANHFGRRYRHHIVAMDGGTDAFARLEPEVQASLLDVPRKGNLWADIRTFRRVLRSLHPDLLVTSNWGTIEWAIANLDGRVRHLHMEDGFGREESGGQIARRVWLRRLVLRRATVALPSRKLLVAARELWRLPQEHLVYVPNGVDCARFRTPRDPQLLAKFGIRSDIPVVGTVSGLRPEKNIRRLVDAFAEVLGSTPAQLVIVGDGATRPDLEARTASLGIADRVIFTGNVREPEKLLAAFSVFALSSDTEQMPLSVLEAMAAGLPVAATDVGDVSEMLAEENRPFVVAPGERHLAAAILSLLREPARARAIGVANGRRAADVFDQDRMFAAYRKLFDGEQP